MTLIILHIYWKQFAYPVSQCQESLQRSWSPTPRTLVLQSAVHISQGKCAVTYKHKQIKYNFIKLQIRSKQRVYLPSLLRATEYLSNLKPLTFANCCIADLACSKRSEIDVFLLPFIRLGLSTVEY